MLSKPSLGLYSAAWPLIWMWRLADIQWALSLYLDGFLCAWKGNPILPLLVWMLFVSWWFYLSPVRGALCQRSQPQTVLHTKLHISPVLVISFAFLHLEFSFSLSEVWLSVALDDLCVQQWKTVVHPFCNNMRFFEILLLHNFNTNI